MGSVAVFGAGGLLGSTIARELAHFPDITSLWLVDVDNTSLELAAAEAAMIAEKLRQESLTVHIKVVDMLVEEQISDLLSLAKPDVIVQAAIPRSWYSFSRRFEPALWSRLNSEARMGPWLPLFLLLPMKLMLGRRDAGLASPVVQISYPDAVNAVLHGMDLGPACGAGNSENIATVMRIVAAKHLRLPSKEVTVRLVANHFHAWALDAGADITHRPLWYRVLANDQDAISQLDTDAFWADVRTIYPRQRPMYAATAAVKNTIRLLRNDRTVSHVNSPRGLTGGTDARLTRDGVEIVWPTGIQESEAREMLVVAQQGDGIASIGGDGTVHFVDSSHEAMKALIGYDCPVLAPSDIESRAHELIGLLPAPSV